MRTGLQELGYVEGSNLIVEARWADGNIEALPGLAAELAARDVDVIVTHGIPATRAAQGTGRRVPVVMAIVADPVAAGLVRSYARPGNNTTGSAWFASELSAKRVALLKEAKPQIARVAVLVNPRNPAFSRPMVEAMERLADTAGVALRAFDAGTRGDFAVAFAAMERERMDAVVVLEEALLNSYPAELAGLARRHRLPAAGNREFAEAGGLIGYGADLHQLFRRAAHFVDRILAGTPAGELPVEQASQFELVLNRAAARAIDFAFPQSLSLRADKVVG